MQHMVKTGFSDKPTSSTPADAMPLDIASLPDELRKRDRNLRAWAWLPDSVESSETVGGALSGMPFGVKDVIDVRNMPTRCGASLPENEQPRPFDAVAVAQLRRAGAIPVGKTVTAEYAYVGPGPTRNPWNTAHTPGGSSSGSAAAVAAGMVPMALGTQTGGSMIRPAAFNGIVGFKPSFGSIHRGGMTVLCETLDTIGWFTRDVALARRILGVLLPGHEASQWPADRLPRIALLPSRSLGTLSAGAEATLMQAADQIRRLGGSVEMHEPDAELTRLTGLHADIMAYELARGMLPFIQRGEQRLSQGMRATIERGMAIPARHYLDCMRERASLQARWQERFADYDAILTPSAPGEAPEGLGSTGSSVFNRVWSLLGWPCLHLPIAMSATGLPLGVQLVGKPNQDDALLSFAHIWHARLDRRPAGISAMIA